MDQPVRQYMTLAPITIEASTSISDADKIMRDRHIRHLPVVHEGKVTGLLTLHQLHLALLTGDAKPDAPVSEAMYKEPYVVAPETPVSQVVHGLADGKGPCAIVCEEDRVVGVFTAVDALRSPGKDGR